MERQSACQRWAHNLDPMSALVRMQQIANRSLDFHGPGTTDVLLRCVHSELTFCSAKTVYCTCTDAKELEMVLKAMPQVDTLEVEELLILSAEHAKTVIDRMPLSRRSIVSAIGIDHSADCLLEVPDNEVPLVLSIQEVFPDIQTVSTIPLGQFEHLFEVDDIRVAPGIKKIGIPIKLNSHRKDDLLRQDDLFPQFSAAFFLSYPNLAALNLEFSLGNADDNQRGVIFVDTRMGYAYTNCCFEVVIHGRPAFHPHKMNLKQALASDLELIRMFAGVILDKGDEHGVRVVLFC